MSYSAPKKEATENKYAKESLRIRLKVHAKKFFSGCSKKKCSRHNLYFRQEMKIHGEN